LENLNTTPASKSNKHSALFVSRDGENGENEKIWKNGSLNWRDSGQNQLGVGWSVRGLIERGCKGVD